MHILLTRFEYLRHIFRRHVLEHRKSHPTLRARALIVVPAVNSAAIVTPVFLEGAIYGQFPRPMTVVFIAVVIVGVVLLSTGAAARVSGGDAAVDPASESE